MDFVYDSFTDTNGTLLDSHIGELGASWTFHPGYNANKIDITSNSLRNTDGNNGCYYASGIPPSPNYSVSATLFANTVPGTTGGRGVAGRMNIAQDTLYAARYRSDLTSWELYKNVNTAQTSLGTAGVTLIASTSYTIKLRMIGSSITMLVNGVPVIGPVVDTSITDTGRAGVRADNMGGAEQTILDLTATADPQQLAANHGMGMGRW